MSVIKGFLLPLVLVVILISMAIAQGRGSGGMQGQRGSGMGGPQGGYGGPGRQGMPSASHATQQEQFHSRMRATDQQRSQYRTCTQSIQRVHKRVRELSKLIKSRNPNLPDARRMHAELASDLQQMDAQRQAFSSGLNDEQRAALRDRLEQMERGRQQLETMSQVLGYELERDQWDHDTARQQLHTMESTSKELQDQQQQLGADLGIEE